MKSKTVKTVSELAPIFNNNKSFALFCHTQPDGDTVGSALALAFALRKIGKTADVFCDEDIGEKLKTFVPIDEIKSILPSEKYDVYVSVDCADPGRLGNFESDFIRAKETVVIDHHMGRPFAKYSYIGDFSSTAEIIYSLILSLKIDLDFQISSFLYIGVITDTGNFMHSNTNSNTFAVAGELAKHGVKIPQLCRVFFRDTSIGKAKLMGKILSRMRCYYDDRFCLIYVLEKDLQEFGLTQDAAKNIVDNAINVKTALVGASLVESGENTFRVSIRGKDFEIRSIAERFGGGGHKYASGCVICGFFEDVVDKLVRYVGERFEEEKII